MTSFWVVALDALAPEFQLVTSPRRQHVDRVVGHALHQQAEALLARAACPAPAALGDVAGDLGEADQLAVLVADRVDHHAGPEAGAVLAHAPALGLELALLRAVSQRAAGRPRARSSSV
jgi:hypothetical protein